MLDWFNLIESSPSCEEVKIEVGGDEPERANDLDVNGVED